MTTQPFDNREGVIWIDGKFVNWPDARIHVLSHALHYGSAVFEGERAYNGKVFKLHQHSLRLHKSAQALGFNLAYSTEEIDRITIELLGKNKLINAYIRPIAWRGSEEMGVAASGQTAHLAIAAWKWPSYFSAEARAKGIKLMISPWVRPASNMAPTSAKASGLYIICTLSRNLAEQKGFNDALMLDYRGQVAEATGANIFMVKDGQLHTPTPDCFLDGITRRTVIELANRLQIPVVERAIMPDEFATADEVFLTGTAVEVTSVCQIGNWHFTNGKITAALIDAYAKEVGAASAPSAG